MGDMSLEPLAKKRLSDYAEASLKDYIEWQLKAGNTKLPSEVELAQALSVSRTTIRRALSDLGNKRFIRRIRKRNFCKREF